MAKQSRKMVKTKASSRSKDAGLHKFDHAYNALQYSAAYQLGSRIADQHDRNIDFLARYGHVCYGVGRVDEAVSAFNVLLRIQPNNVQVLYYLGVIMQDQGHDEQALALWLAALQHQPDYYHALRSLLKVYLRQQQWPKLAAIASMMLKKHPENPDVWSYLKIASQHVNIFQAMPEIADLLEEQLPKGGLGSSTHIFAVALSVARKRHAGLDALYQLNCKPVVNLQGPTISISTHGSVAERFAQSLATLKSDYDLSSFLAATNDPLLHLVLKDGLIPTSDFELFVCTLRYYAVNQWIHHPDACRKAGTDYVDIVAALAHYLFLCEYLPSMQAEETEWHAALLKQCEALPADAKIDDEMAALWSLLACYQPLDTLPLSASLHQKAEGFGHAMFTSLVTQACDNLLKEKKRAEDIASFGSIGDVTSQAVREQYEENPYPRWTKMNTDFPAFRNATRMMHELFPKSAHYAIQVPDNHRGLIAGCGTGKHILQEAVQFPKAKLLGIDLSRRSLAYASLQLEQSGFHKNIELMHGDILELKSLKRRFHVIESAGVLHHMKDPMQGWRVLTDCLHPGGLMMIGLYSKTARQKVIEAREMIAAQHYGESLEEIRRFRDEMRTQNKEAGVSHFSDYYSTSSCRDLLFHRQEHQFTIPMIQDALDELGLIFLGFIHRGDTLDRYNARFRDDQQVQQLAHWHILEEETPNLFSNMYQFWCYKPAK